MVTVQVIRGSVLHLIITLCGEHPPWKRFTRVLQLLHEGEIVFPSFLYDVCQMRSRQLFRNSCLWTSWVWQLWQNYRVHKIGSLFSKYLKVHITQYRYLRMTSNYTCSLSIVATSTFSQWYKNKNTIWLIPEYLTFACGKCSNWYILCDICHRC